MAENILGTEKITKLFAKFSIPAIIAMLIAGMQSVVDGIFVGNFVSSNSMASVSIGAPFMQIVIGVSMLVSVGALSYMGRSLGENKIEQVQDIFKTSFISLSIVAVFFTIIGFLFSSNIAKFFGANDVLLNEVSLYIKTISICILPMSLAFLFGFSNRLLGKPDLYFKGMVLSLITNITLNFILIKILKLGIVGAALATGISYSSVFLVVVHPLIKKSSLINIFIGKFKKTIIIPVAYNGLSEAIASVTAAISAFLFNMAFIKFAGEDGVTAFSSIGYVTQFGSLIIFGIGDGISSIISYNYGAKYMDRVKSIFNLAMKIALCVGTLTFICVFFFSENLVKIFVPSNYEVINIAVSGSKIYALAYLIIAITTLSSSYFTAIGYAKESVIIALSRGLIFIAIGITVLPSIFGINGVWLTIPFSEFMTLFICLHLNKKYGINKLLEYEESSGLAVTK